MAYNNPIRLNKATYKEGVCPKCNGVVPTGTNGAWLWNGRIYHPTCTPTDTTTTTAQTAHTTTTYANAAAPSPSGSPPIPQVRCETCRVFVPQTELTGYILADRTEPIHVCEFCARLVRAQYQLKLLGLWKRPSKPAIRFAAQAMGAESDEPDEGQTRGDG